ncbi:MAG: SDR family oxidoreductase [Pseudomonadota bacterium]|nr:SDR family oxidoreductase [Pseudomonadota bacterium]
MRLLDKVAIVTGSTSGIGRAAAERFAREGAHVLVTGRSKDEGEAVATALNDTALRDGTGEAAFVAADASSSEGVREVVAAAVQRWGRVDLLVNNAAMMTFDPISDLEEEDWDKVLAVNLRGPFLFTKYCLPHMSEGSAIVNVSSVHAAATMSGVVPYASSKGGLEAFTRALAVELRERKIRVNAVRLGAVDTPMLWENPNVKSGKEKIDPADVGSPDQIAEAILFLVSNASGFATGAVLNVDGGRLARLG